MTSPEHLARELLPVLRQCCRGVYGIALGGSCAKERGDHLSDVDLYIFAAAVLPAAQREDLVRVRLGEVAEVASWGVEEPFVQGGTDFLYRGERIECWFRSSEQITSTLAACLQGRVRREYVGWTLMGFFNYAVLSDLHTMRILEDPDGMLGRWQAEVSRYPEPLRQAILQRFLREALFWPENPHYRSAVERLDRIYTSGIVQQVLHALIQVVFALNREYFPGEKQLARALGALPLQPHDFGSRLQALLGAPAPAVEPLRAQKRALGALVAEVEQLVRAHADLESPRP